jgi:hypothetical protein
MILSDKDKNENTIVIPEDRVFVIEDGTTFNLDDPHSKAEWEAIQHCKLISPARDARDSSGKLIIDGEDSRHSKSYSAMQNARYGSAELYVERPGQDAIRKISKKKLKNTAENFIFGDNHEGLILKARLMGRDMRYQSLADIQDYLIGFAERDPQRIINLYTGDDMHIRLLLIDAIQKRIIIIKNKLYTFSDSIILGATEDAAITWMKQPANTKVLELIKKDTYPEVYEVTNPETREALEEIQKSRVSKKTSQQ